MLKSLLEALNLPKAFISFATHYQLAAYGLIVITLSFLQKSPIEGVEIVDSMRYLGVAVGMVLIIVSIFRPRKGPGA